MFWEEKKKIGGKGENAGYQNFLLFLQYFQKGSPRESLEVGIVWYRVNTLNLALSKLKAYAGIKSNVIQYIIIVFHKIENFVRKGENTVSSSSSFSYIVFKKLISQVIKTQDSEV